MDQLSGLRQMLREQVEFVPPQARKAPVIWSICSGKGGTGKSLIAAGLALLLSRSGKKVLLVDADFNLPGLQVYFNHLEVANFPENDADIDEIGKILSEVNSDLHLCMPKAQNPVMDDRTWLLRKALQHIVSGDYDIILIDLPGGFSAMHHWFTEKGQLATVVVGQDYGSFANSYALIKLMKQTNPTLAVGIWANQITGERQARLLHRKLNLALDHFLEQSADFHGWLPHLPEIQQQLAETQPMIFWPSHMSFFQRLKKQIQQNISTLTLNEERFYATV